MYEKLVAYLLGKRNGLSEKDICDFFDLLADSFKVGPEYLIFSKYCLIESMMDKAEITSFKDRMVAGTKLNKLFRIETKEDQEQKRPLSRIKQNGSKIFGTGKSIEERAIEAEKYKNRINSDVKERVKTDLAVDRSKRVKVADGVRNGTISNVFDDDFKEEEFHSNVNDIINTLQQQKKEIISGLNERNYFKKISDEEDEFVFEIEDLDEYHDTGPEYTFDLN